MSFETSVQDIYNCVGKEYTSADQRTIIVSYFTVRQSQLVLFHLRGDKQNQKPSAKINPHKNIPFPLPIIATSMGFTDDADI